MEKITNVAINSQQITYDQKSFTVISDTKDLYLIPEELADYLGFSWDKSMRRLTRDFATVHFGGPSLCAFHPLAPEVIPLFLMNSWLMEVLKQTIRRDPAAISELNTEAIAKIKRFHKNAKRVFDCAFDAMNGD
jgi:hypothetical protein